MRTGNTWIRSLVTLGLISGLATLGGCSLLTDSEIKPSGITAPCSSDDDCHASTCSIRAGDAKGICVSSCEVDSDCPAPTICANKTCQKPLKVGGIWVGITTYREGWTLTHDQGVKAAAADLGYVKVETAEGMFGEPIIAAVDKMVADGNELIIFNSFDHRGEASTLAKKYPNVKFLVCSGRPQSPNLGAYFAHLEQAWYVAGKISAGIVDENKRLGFVGSYITPEVVRHLNAWILGARSVDPQIQVEIRWTGFWYDWHSAATFAYTPKFAGAGAAEQKLFAEEYATALLIDGGASVIGHQSDNQRPGVYVESKAGPIYKADGTTKRNVWVIANDNQYGWRNEQDPQNPVPYKTSIGAVYWNWTPLYTRMFEDVHRDQWQVYDINEAMGQDKATSLVGFEPNTESLAGIDDTQVKQLLTAQAKLDYREVFKGPIETTDPNQRASIPDGEYMKPTPAEYDKELRQMCWFTKGVVEKSDPMNPSSADVDAKVPVAGYYFPSDPDSMSPHTPPFILMAVGDGVPRGIAWDCATNQIPE